MFIFNNKCSKFDIEWIQKIQKVFLWYSSKPEIDYKTLWNTFEESGLKYVDIKVNIISLQWSWVKKLFHDKHHDWKIIPLFLINKYFGKNFHFHPNLSFNLSLVDSFPESYKQTLINWSTYFVSKIPSCIQLNFLRYKKHLWIDNGPVYLQLTWWFREL